MVICSHSAKGLAFTLRAYSLMQRFLRPLGTIVIATAGLVPAVARAQQADTAHPQVAVHASGATPQMTAVRRTEPIAIDGRLDEPLWQTAPAATDFRQQDPNEGQPATQRT